MFKINESRQRTPFNDVTLVIKTFERPHCLKLLLHSYQRLQQRMGWQCPIIIADDSQHPYKDQMMAMFGSLITHYICLPFNVGVSAGRNALLDQVKTKYFVLCDDDFIFDKRADLAFMHHVLETSDVELLGGIFLERWTRCHGESKWEFLNTRLRNLNFTPFWHVLLNRETVKRFQGCFELDEQTLYAMPIEYKSPFTYCNYVHNFFMADIEVFRARGIRWHELFKVHEHEAFFFEAKQKGLRVATTEEVGIVHQPMKSKTYNAHRYPGEHYRKLFLEYLGLKRFVNVALGIDVML